MQVLSNPSVLHNISLQHRSIQAFLKWAMSSWLVSVTLSSFERINTLYWKNGTCNCSEWVWHFLNGIELNSIEESECAMHSDWEIITFVSDPVSWKIHFRGSDVSTEHQSFRNSANLLRWYPREKSPQRTKHFYKLGKCLLHWIKDEMWKNSLYWPSSYAVLYTVTQCFIQTRRKSLAPQKTLMLLVFVSKEVMPVWCLSNPSSKGHLTTGRHDTVSFDTLGPTTHTKTVKNSSVTETSEQQEK